MERGFGIRHSAFDLLGRVGMLALVSGAALAANASPTSAATTPTTPTTGSTAATDVTTTTVRELPPLGPGPVAPTANLPAGSHVAPAANAAALPEGAPAGLRRCVGADGIAVFTDRRCELMGSQEVTPPVGEPRVAGALPSVGIVRVRSCARNQDDLLEGVRGALESRDANRFAEFYHWAGMGNAEGYQLMGRLAHFAERPLVDVQLVSSAERQPTPPPFSAPSSLDDPRFESAEPRPTPARRADLLRVDQMRGDEDVETLVTWFHLRSNAGCWWLQF